METGIQADAKRSVRVIFRLDRFTLTPHPCLLFDVSYHVPRLGVSRQSCNKDSRAAAPFSFVDTFEPSASRFENTETANSMSNMLCLPFYVKYLSTSSEGTTTSPKSVDSSTLYTTSID